jgi:uncharacterized membrane protein
MPDDAAFCPGCGHAMRPVVARGMVGVLPENVAGALAYFTIIPAIIFLLVEPYNKNRFVRFHCFQCFGLCLVGLVAGATLRIAGFVLFFIPAFGPLLLLLVSMVVGLAFLAIWAVLIVKALQGEMLELPLVGEFAEQQATK